MVSRVSSLLPELQPQEEGWDGLQEDLHQYKQNSIITHSNANEYNLTHYMRCSKCPSMREEMKITLIRYYDTHLNVKEYKS